MIFMPLAWKVRQGHLVIGSSVRLSVCLSVCPFVCLFVRLSVRNSIPLTIKVQYLKFGWWYNYQTWTVSSSKGCSHFTDITRPRGVGRGKNVGLRDFCHNWTLLPPGASVFHKHMSSLLWNVRFFALFFWCSPKLGPLSVTSEFRKFKSPF